MDQKSSHGLETCINEDLPLIPVTTTDVNYSCCLTTDKAFDYDSSLFQTSSQPQAFNFSLSPLSAIQQLVRLWPSTIPTSHTDSTDSYSPVIQHEDFGATAFDYDSSLSQTSSQLEAFNVSPPSLLALPQLTRSRLSTDPPPFTDNPTMSKSNIDCPRLPSGPLNPPATRPPIYTSIRSAATTDTAFPSPPTFPHTAPSNDLPSCSENRKSRRRAQNCAAQRAFRARKDEALKESSRHLEILKAELGRLVDDNGSLRNTVSGLRSEVYGLRREHDALRRVSVGESGF